MHFTELTDLAAERLGGAVLMANDEFFASKDNLLKAAKPIFLEGKYTGVGKWMDGWETRRRRTPGFDWCIIRLGLRGVPRGIVVDTANFRGNYPEACSLEACDIKGLPNVEQLMSAEWTEILPQSALKGDSQNEIPIDSGRVSTHLRFKIYPDGGVARLRVHGEVEAVLPYTGEIDLAAIEKGGLVVAASDMFFGSRQNLIMPGRSRDMSDGWETRRRRGPGYDWCVIRLGACGLIHRVEVDTSYFKGNYPDSCLLETCAEDGSPQEVLLPQIKLQGHTRHVFVDELRSIAPASHIRFSIFPDGGVSRLRLYGLRTPPAISEHDLLACCGSRRWVRSMAQAQPFRTVEQLLEAGNRAWWELAPEDWLEAFAAHPRIGERSTDGQAAREQSGVQDAPADLLARVVAGNREYEKRFGHIYIVCASGKSAAQLLQILESRLNNDPAAELRVAAAEQSEITKLRIEKWLARQ